MGRLGTLLREVLLVKGFAKPDAPETVDCARAAKRLGFRKDELYRYLYNDRTPGDDAKRRLVDGLELDANFVLETAGKRFDGMSVRTALAHMALDRYLQNDDRISDSERADLRHIADQHPEPPLWSTEWNRTKLGLDLVHKRRSIQGDPQVGQSRRYQERRTRRAPQSQ